METALDLVRLGRCPMTDELVSVLRCKDHVEALLGLVGASGVRSTPDLEGRGVELLTALRRVRAAMSMPGIRKRRGRQCCQRRCDTHRRGACDWHLCVRFGAGVLTSGMDPLGFIRYLRHSARSSRCKCSTMRCQRRRDGPRILLPGF